MCGICSVSQSVAATRAIAAAQGLVPMPNGQLVTNIVHATENIADHLTHFHLFFMPDFARPAYVARLWFDEMQARFGNGSGGSRRAMLAPRAEFLHVVGILAGKWPHTMTLQPGGAARVVTANELRRLSGVLAGFRRYLEAALFGGPLDAFAALTDEDALLAWAEARPRADLSLFLRASRDLGLNRLGRGNDHYLSFGAYPRDDTCLFAPGRVNCNDSAALDTARITEDVSHAWLADDGPARHPIDGRTEPDPEMRTGYSWCKAPRLDGAPAETGALARLVVAGNPLLCSLTQKGGNAEARIVARMVEIARVLPEMERWLHAIRPEEPFIAHGETPPAARGAGLTEAARGALGHWLRVEGGRIANYQIIAPTTWNFSPRDASGTPGPLEQALVGLPVAAGEDVPVMVQHVVRSFDPCMVCTVH
ncbi:nickel-dependent hydrogenase large subunit [Profundibacter sp.]|uniref:nickel-dependent hydrogenase large subunit n=1 Tax=Profundibacter sp. TaxID=3101071 RepID=UPI003D115F68